MTLRLPSLFESSSRLLTQIPDRKKLCHTRYDNRLLRFPLSTTQRGGEPLMRSNAGAPLSRRRFLALSAGGAAAGTAALSGCALQVSSGVGGSGESITTMVNDGDVAPALLKQAQKKLGIGISLIKNDVTPAHGHTRQRAATGPGARHQRPGHPVLRRPRGRREPRPVLRQEHGPQSRRPRPGQRPVALRRQGPGQGPALRHGEGLLPGLHVLLQHRALRRGGGRLSVRHRAGDVRSGTGRPTRRGGWPCRTPATGSAA